MEFVYTSRSPAFKRNKIDDLPKVNTRFGTNDLTQLIRCIAHSPIPKILRLLIIVIEHQTQHFRRRTLTPIASNRLNIRHVDVFPASPPNFCFSSATLVVPAVTDLIAIDQDLSFSGTNGFYCPFAHSPKPLITLTVIICTDMKTLVIWFLDCAYSPRTADDRVSFEQLHRTVGGHLRRDNRTQIVL